MVMSAPRWRHRQPVPCQVQALTRWDLSTSPRWSMSSLAQGHLSEIVPPPVIAWIARDRPTAANEHTGRQAEAQSHRAHAVSTVAERMTLPWSFGARDLAVIFQLRTSH